MVKATGNSKMIRSDSNAIMNNGENGSFSKTNNQKKKN